MSKKQRAAWRASEDLADELVQTVGDLIPRKSAVWFYYFATAQVLRPEEARAYATEAAALPLDESADSSADLFWNLVQARVGRRRRKGIVQAARMYFAQRMLGKLARLFAMTHRGYCPRPPRFRRPSPAPSPMLEEVTATP